MADEKPRLADEAIEALADGWAKLLPQAFPSAHALFNALCCDAQHPFSIPVSFFPDQQDTAVMVQMLKDRRDEIAKAFMNVLQGVIELNTIPLHGLDRDATWDDVRLRFTPDAFVIRKRIRYYIHVSIRAEGMRGYTLKDSAVWKTE